VLYLGPERITLTIASAAVAAALIIAVLLTIPHDTGLLPQPLIVTSLVTSVVVSSGVLLLIVSYALSEAARAETAAEREYERSERLLTNILPSPIAARLKSESNVVIADRHDEASILFADMAGFTAQASDTADFRHPAFRLTSPQGTRRPAAHCWCRATTPRHVTVFAHGFELF
jgi:adenylate cyclase